VGVLWGMLSLLASLRRVNNRDKGPVRCSANSFLGRLCLNDRNDLVTKLWWWYFTVSLDMLVVFHSLSS
jgi:hypothetical protein